jgi:uncharacterized membrane protein (DUF485 family)
MTGDQGTYDWDAIARSEQFRALVSDRGRWTAVAGGLTMGLCIAYIVVAYLAPDVLGSALGWAVGVGLIVLTWIVSFAYLRRSDEVWGPMEERIVRERTGRFDRAAAPDRERVS